MSGMREVVASITAAAAALAGGLSLRFCLNKKNGFV